ncbi:17.6 kDa class i heat shock protein 2 [Phtheirospermum japonicum]|uniref:17.6 kDa class i heat shock protein 2 n=1 Tax=Phtheirospermum japonicum TaxID=374723 RepID=A0A830D405_9LAMI|nr:17.6 kDa class i heat shock protein 2 [Phtheirospermum japonicum]
MPIFRHNRRAHFHDPFPTNIWDPLSDLNNEQHIICSPHVRQNATMGIWDHFGDFNDNRIICTPLVRQNANAIMKNPFEWHETPEAHILRAEIPGFKKAEVKVEVEEGKFLKISGEKSVERQEMNEKGHQFESSKGQFLRAFKLPENCRTDGIWFIMEDGVIMVTAPKK